MRPVRKRATYQDLYDLPENVVGEIIDGALYTSPRPASPHAHACAAVFGDLYGNFNGPPGDRGRLGEWFILVEPEFHFDADILVSDLAGWRRERMPQMPSVAYFKLPPDWLCEVISSSTRDLDRNQKQLVYARAGIPHFWLIEPLAKTLEVLRLENGRWRLVAKHDGDERVSAEPFDAVELDLEHWWI